jgi:Rad51
LQVRLVLVDSVAFPFRMHHVEWAKQVVLLSETAAALRRLAARGVAVVVTNQVTGYSANAFEDLKPALGARLGFRTFHHSTACPEGDLLRTHLMQQASAFRRCSGLDTTCLWHSWVYRVARLTLCAACSPSMNG